MIASTAIIYPDVKLGVNVIIEDFCIIGQRFPGSKGVGTVIGDNAVIRAHTIIYAGNTIGDGFQTGNKANIRELNQIGNNVSIGTLSVIEHHVEIEDEVRVHTQVFIPEFSLLKKGAWVGPNVVFTNARYPKSEGVKESLKGPQIMEAARIGANSTLLPGVIIGENSLVGAGSVVIKNVEPWSVVAGQPAHLLRMMDC